MTLVAASGSPTPPAAIGIWYWGRRGGGSRYTWELADALVELGHPVVAWVMPGNDMGARWAAAHGAGRMVVRSGRAARGRVGRLRSLLAHVAVLVPGPWSVGGWFARRRVGGVVVTMTHPALLATAWTLRAARVPFALVVHDAEPHPGDGGRLLAWITRRAARHASALVVLSDHVRQQVVRWPGRDADQPLTVVPHGPFYAAIARTRPPAVARRFLFFGRLRAYKGVELLLDAWPPVHERHPDAVLRIAGSGAAPELVARAEATGGVELDHRWFDDSEVPALFDAADVVVLPYVEASQSGVVTIAQSLGVPMIVTEVGGLVEQLDGGALVCAPTATGLRDAMLHAAAVELTPPGTPVSWLGVASSVAGIIDTVTTAPPASS